MNINRDRANANTDVNFTPNIKNQNHDSSFKVLNLSSKSAFSFFNKSASNEEKEKKELNNSNEKEKIKVTRKNISKYNEHLNEF